MSVLSYNDRRLPQIVQIVQGIDSDGPSIQKLLFRIRNIKGSLKYLLAQIAFFHSRKSERGIMANLHTIDIPTPMKAEICNI